jgi:hypothetical protein
VYDCISAFLLIIAFWECRALRGPVNAVSVL